MSEIKEMNPLLIYSFCYPSPNISLWLLLPEGPLSPYGSPAIDDKKNRSVRSSVPLGDIRKKHATYVHSNVPLFPLRDAAVSVVQSRTFLRLNLLSELTNWHERWDKWFPLKWELIFFFPVASVISSWNIFISIKMWPLPSVCSEGKLWRGRLGISTPHLLFLCRGCRARTDLAAMEEENWLKG